jgi:hypothetical protein
MNSNIAFEFFDGNPPLLWRVRGRRKIGKTLHKHSAWFADEASAKEHVEKVLADGGEVEFCERYRGES